MKNSSGEKSINPESSQLDNGTESHHAAQQRGRRFVWVLTLDKHLLEETDDVAMIFMGKRLLCIWY
jgi:hypothetical protein